MTAQWGNLPTLLTDPDTLDAVTNKDAIGRLKVQFASDFIESSGLLRRLEEWSAEDRKGSRPGGRPAAVTMRSVLIAWLLLAQENSPMLVTEIHTVLYRRITKRARRENNIPSPGGYFTVWRTLNRIRDLVDPFPAPRRKRLTPEEWAEVLNKRDPETSAIKQQRLDWFANQILEATQQAVPELYRNWDGNIVVDATVMPSPARSSYSRSGKLNSDPDAAWYRRNKDDRDSDLRENQPSRSGKAPRSVFVLGYEIEILLQFRNKGPRRSAEFPALAIGMAFHKPAVKPAVDAIKALHSVHERGHQPGYLVGDRLYAPNSKPAKYQIPARQMGYELVMDYRIDQLGAKGDPWEGMKLVEGTWYCPSMPDTLVNATLDYRNNDIDEETWRKRLATRRDFAFRAKEKPDKNGAIAFMCPSYGRGATLDCELKNTSINGQPPHNTVRAIGLGMPLLNPPKEEDRGKACTNRSSITVPIEVGAKYYQPLHYESDEWNDIYRQSRNSIEGYNAYIKDDATFALKNRGRRLIRGYTSQYLAAAFTLAAANLRKIADFLTKRERPQLPERFRWTPIDSPETYNPVDYPEDSDDDWGFRPNRDAPGWQAPPDRIAA